MSKKRGASLPAGLQVGRPMIAVVGRPNVGKSTLFNKLAGKRLALVEDTPGVTRDRHYADSFILGHEVVIIDTGGFDPESDDPMKEGIARQVGLALEECDVVLCVFDGSVEPMQSDREAVRLLRDADRPVVYAANKCETDGRIAQAMSYYELGMDELLPISALHGRGLGALDEALAAALPPAPEDGPNELPEMTPRVALIGRPNAGKSSLLNRILGEDRQLVDHRPGTTVDAIDAVVEVEGEPLVLIDTAGMRRKRAVNKGIEGLGVIKAIRSVERCHVAVLMVDADRGIAEQDAKVLGLALDRGRAIVIALNKCDLLDQAQIKEASQRVREVLQFVSWAEIIPISAKTGRGVPKLMKRVKAAVTEHRKRVKTGELNRFFEEVLEHHPPPTYRKKAVRLYYITQAMAGPPTFMVSTNFPQAVHFSYQRYVINQIRERFGFQGTPLRVRYRPKKKREQDR